MKILAPLSIAVLLLLNGCQKSADVPVQTNPPTTANPTTDLEPLVWPSIGGVIPLPEDKYNKLLKYTIDLSGGRLGADPINFDVPPPGNQQDEGSCVGFAAGYAVRSYLYHIEKGTSYYSGLNVRNNKSVFSPRFIYNSVLHQSGITEDKGMLISDALELMKNIGVCTWEDMPYIQKQFLLPVSDAQRQLAGNYKIWDYTSIKVDDGYIKDYIKAYLKKKGLPVIIGIICDQGFQKPKENINNGYQIINKEYYWKEFKSVFLDKDGAPYRHAITIIGFDDSKHAFKLLNSHGNNWTTLDGTLWMDYNLFDATTSIKGVNQRVVNEAYAVINSPDGLVPVNTVPTGKIDLSYICDGYGSVPKRLTYETYHYDLVIHTNDAYAKALKKYLCLILPDKKAYYRIELENGTSGDGKTFTGSLYYAPFSATALLINGKQLENPYYTLYDIAYLPSNIIATGLQNSDYYSPIGTYECVLAIQKEDGKYVQTVRKPFPKPFFDITACISHREPSPSIGLYTIDL